VVVPFKTIAFRFTPSPLVFVTANCSTGTLKAPGICVESGGVCATVAIDITGIVGVLVAVFVVVGVAVFVTVSVFVGVSVGVGVNVFVAVNVAVFVAV